MLTVDAVVSAALEHADKAEKREKEAEVKEIPPSFTSDIAAQMYKAAAQLKSGAATRVTHADVKSFAKRIAG